MKHLTSYKIFESTIGETMETLKDIALEITDEDERYKVDVYDLSPNLDEILVRITKVGYIDILGISKTLNRMIDYMESDGYDYFINIDYSLGRKYKLGERLGKPGLVTNNSKLVIQVLSNSRIDIRFQYGWKKFKKK